MALSTGLPAPQTSGNLPWEMPADISAPVSQPTAAAPATPQSASPQPSSGGASGKITPDAMAQYLVGKGLTPAQAQGAAQAFMSESGGDPTAYNPQGGNLGAYGIAQDRGARQKRLIEMYGPTPTAKQQLDFAWYELNTSEKGALTALKNAQTPQEAQTAITQHFERPSLQSAWSTFTPEERQMMHARTAEAQKNSDKMAAFLQEYAARANAAPEGSKERDDLIAKMRADSAEMMSDWRKKIANPPIAHPVDAWQGMGSAGFILAALTGLFSRQHLTAGLTAAGNALNAINQNSKEEFKRQYDMWRDQVDLGTKMISMENENIRSLIEDKKMSTDEKQAQLATMAVEFGIVKQIGENNVGNLDAQLQYVGQRQRALDAFKEKNLMLQLVAQNRMGSTPQGQAYEKFLQEHPDATSEEIQAFLQRGHTARSGPAAATQKFLQEHPDATAEEVSQFVAHVRAQGAAEQAFETGTQGNTVRSINVAMNHTDTLLELGKALQNNDVQALNRLKNQVKTEFGWDGALDFNFAKQIVGDEIVKAVLGNNAGALEDRRELKSTFDAANTPQQLLGVVHAADALLAGQLQELKRQYEGSGLTNFDQKLSPKTKTRLGTLPQGGSYSSPEDVYKAFDAGRLTKEQAKKILIDNFGAKPQ